MGITHRFHTDTCIRIFIADVLGGLSIGWWKRNLTLSHFAISTANPGIHESFAQKMLRTTMDVDCPPWLDFVHGGLQFQVIHHLYPRIPRHNLHRAQKYVKEFCHDVGIPYVIFGFARGNKEVISRLGEIAGQLRVLEECRKVAAKDLIEGYHGPQIGGFFFGPQIEPGIIDDTRL